MTGLQDAVQEWKNAPLVSTLPQPSFASSSSVHLEEGMHQMSEVVTAMSETALLDQGSQEEVVKNTWKGLKRGETAVALRSGLVLLLGSLVCCTSRLVD